MHWVFFLLAHLPWSHARAVDITHLPATPNSSDSYNTTTDFACNCLPAEDCPKNCMCCLDTVEYDRFLLYGGTFVKVFVVAPKLELKRLTIDQTHGLLWTIDLSIRECQQRTRTTQQL